MRLHGEGLACERGGRIVFSGLRLSVEAGAALLVVGPNGAGKSSLLRLLAGLVTPTAGSLALEGGDAELGVGRQSHYVGHQDALKSSLTVGENLAFWRGFFDHPASSVGDALDALGIGHLETLPAAYLSAGQRRRLAFARLLVSKRPVWLLDEPTAALDAAAEERLLALVAAHQEAGGIVVAATHLPLPLPRAGRFDIAAFAPPAAA